MTIVDLFCGGGGLSYGLAQAGHTVLAAYDWWQPALDFYNRNIRDHHAYQLDLSDVSAAVAEIKRWHPDVIVGGPPCQDFSSAGKRDENGGRASLTTAYAKIITSVRPKFFVMENVDRAIKTHTYRNALRLFKDRGYDLAVAILDASLCGAPQTRKRIVVIGALGRSAAPIIDIYRRNQAHEHLTLRQYFGRELPLDYYYRHPRSYARRGVFGVDEPSPTIRGVNRPIPRGYPGHDGDAAPITTPGLRPLNTRERSRIQTFPRTWDLGGNKSDVEQIIGNAVPCALGEFIGRALDEFAVQRRIKNQSAGDSVSVFLQHGNPQEDDVRVVELEELPRELKVKEESSDNAKQDFKPCKPFPSQMLLAVARKKAKMTPRQRAKGLKGTKIVAKRKRR